VFSLGGILVFAATGTGPFGSGPVEAMLYRLVRLEPALDEVDQQPRGNGTESAELGWHMRKEVLALQDLEPV
jgi:hypothetical protein